MKVEIKGDKEIKNSFSSTEITDELFSPGRGSEEMAKEEVAFDVAGYVLVSAKKHFLSKERTCAKKGYNSLGIMQKEGDGKTDKRELLWKIVHDIVGIDFEPVSGAGIESELCNRIE